MDHLLGFIKGNINLIIVAGGIIVLGFLIWLTVRLSILKLKLLSMQNGKVGNNTVDRNTLAMHKRKEAPSLRGDMDDMRSEFDRRGSAYLVLSQMIPLFPMFGILGTVAGLMLAVPKEGAGALMGLDIALSSTLWGLITAIVLKLVAAAFPAKLIYDIETMFEDYERKFRDAIDMKSFEEG